MSFGARDLSVVRNSEVVSCKWNSSWYINCRPLFGGCPLLGVSVIGGSTVSVIRLFCSPCLHKVVFQVNVVIGVSEWGEDALPGVVCSGETSFLTSIGRER